MSENQHFCLKWNHHQHTLVSLFSSLLDTNTFVDCTLAAGGKQIKAHKMIISACSPYFKEILLEHSDTHPIIILNNLQFSELTAIVEFMYRGEVNVSQDQLPSFLKAANTLQIKGLTNDEEEEEEEGSEKSTKKTARTESSATPEPLRKMIKTEPGSVGPPVEDESPKDLSINDSYPMSFHSASEDSAHSSIRLKVDTDDDSHPGAYPIPQAFMKQETYIQSPNSNSTIMGENCGISAGIPCDTSSESKPVVKEERDLDYGEDSETYADLGYTGCVSASESDPVVKNEDAFGAEEVDITITAVESQQTSAEPSLGGGGGLLHQHQQMMNNVSSEDLPHFSGIGFGKMIQLRRPNATEKDAAFKCDECPKFYRSKTSLNLHKRWECGKEPKFACPYCDKKCHQKGNLKVHIISRHRDRINPDAQPSHLNEPAGHMGEPTNHMSEPTNHMREPTT